MKYVFSTTAILCLALFLAAGFSTGSDNRAALKTGHVLKITAPHDDKPSPVVFVKPEDIPEKLNPQNEIPVNPSAKKSPSPKLAPILKFVLLKHLCATPL